MILKLLLCLHISWICIHIALVSLGWVNPWKLGGYGMYTSPGPYHNVVVKLDSNENSELSRKAGNLETRQFREGNNFFVLRCRKLSSENMDELIRANPQLRDSDFTVRVTFDELTGEGVLVQETMHVVSLIWSAEDSFVYSGEVCGDRYAAEGNS